LLDESRRRKARKLLSSRQLPFGGNPILDAVWLFANGVICFQQGYKFFMVALKDQEDAQRIVREIKGLLPAAATA
jgi:hypothetical protein